MTLSASPPLRRETLVAFTLPTLVLGIMHGPEGQIQAIYAKHAGLSLTALAAAILLVKILDGFTYPLIGYLSDRTYARRGTRKGWVIAGSLLSVIGMWNLLRPPAGVGIVYFGAWIAATYFGWKVTEIPLQGWSYGLSADYVQRTRVQAWRALAVFAGQLLFFGIPFLAMRLGYSDSTEIDFRALGVAAVLCSVALPLATLCAVSLVPNGVARLSTHPQRPTLSEVFDAIRKNAPLLRLLAAVLPVSLLGGMLGGVAYLYFDSYLHLGKQYPGIMALALLMSLAGIPFWSWLSTRRERHRVWALSLVICGTCSMTLAFLSPGAAASLLVYAIYPLFVFSFSGSVIVFAMSADIVDYGRLDTGEDHAGLYGSIFQFLQKSLQGLASAAGLAIAGFCGFSASSPSQLPGGVVGIKLTGAVLPALGLLGAAIIIWGYPLTRARVLEIQARLRSEVT